MIVTRKGMDLALLEADAIVHKIGLNALNGESFAASMLALAKALGIAMCSIGEQDRRDALIGLLNDLTVHYAAGGRSNSWEDILGRDGYREFCEGLPDSEAAP